jgi:amino acid transporter
MTEETHNAARSGPIGIIMSIGVSAVLGWFLVLGLLFSIQDYNATVASPTGQPVTQIFLDTVGGEGRNRLDGQYQSVKGVGMHERGDDGFWQVIVIGVMFFCG